MQNCTIFFNFIDLDMPTIYFNDNFFANLMISVFLQI